MFFFYFFFDKIEILLYNIIKDEITYEKEEIYHDKRKSKKSK